MAHGGSFKTVIGKSAVGKSADVNRYVRRRRLMQAACFFLIADAAMPVSAHTGTGLAGGFTSGFLHPFSGFDHLLAMVAVGLWGAFLGRPLIILLPVIFPAVMAVGGVLGMVGVPLPPVEIGIALSVLVLGVMIAGGVRAPVWLASTIVAIFAIFHGYAHGKELPSAADPIGYSVGFVLATGILHVIGIGIGVAKDYRGGVAATRGAGGLIAAAGIYFLTLAVTR
jgi:urease accessory protein